MLPDENQEPIDLDAKRAERDIFVKLSASTTRRLLSAQLRAEGANAVAAAAIQAAQSVQNSFGEAALAIFESQYGEKFPEGQYRFVVDAAEQKLKLVPVEPA